jgi:5-methylcytosine-specific restriction enzyme subunit McrC
MSEVAYGQSAALGSIGRIPIRNLWFLMLYASDLFRHLKKSQKSAAVEDNPDDIADLVAEILTYEVERRLRRNLTFGYKERNADLTKVRGRIQLLTTESRKLLDRGRVACRFNELTPDTPRNRYIRAALETIAGHVDKKSSLPHRCRSLAGSLRRLGVAGQKPDRAEMSQDRLGRHDFHDQQMLAAAQLAFDLALPTEAAGDKPIVNPEREIRWLRKLFEKAVAGFYKYTLPTDKWDVTPGKKLEWPITASTPKATDLIPGMKTDIVLDNREAGKRLVIDTKFNSILTKGWHKDETLRSSYMYQIYAYLRSQEDDGDPLDINSAGCLLHPSIGEMLCESIEIQGHAIHFVTVDLSADAKEIRRQLKSVLRISFGSTFYDFNDSSG